MSRSLCSACFAFGYCQAPRTPLTMDAEIDSPVFIRKVRVFCEGLRIPPSSWQSALTDLYRDMRGGVYVPGPSPAEVSLNMEVFERPGMSDWFKAFCNTLPAPDVRCHVRIEARPRVAVMTTILRGAFPEAAAAWHAAVAANDNEPPANDNIPCKPFICDHHK